jgi:hypothetical protein
MNRSGRRERTGHDGVDVLVTSAPDRMCWLHGYAWRWPLSARHTSACPRCASHPDLLIELRRELAAKSRVTGQADRTLQTLTVLA